MSDNYHLRGQIVTNTGERLTHAWVIDGNFTWFPPRDQPRHLTELHGWFYPGLVDVHGHIGLAERGAASRKATAAQADTDYASGVLLVRDAGVPGDTRWLDTRAHTPLMIRAGRHIARPKRYLPGLAIELDDPGALPATVAREAARSDGWVKLVADWIDRAAGKDARVEPLWDRQILREAIAAAHDNGARVCAHTFATATIEVLLDANIDCIEHGTGMQAEHIAEVARRQIPVTPTLIQTANFLDFAAAGQRKYPAYAAQMQHLYARRLKVLAALVEANVQLLPGSDAGASIPHGTLPRELAAWADAEIDAAAIMDQATWRARAYLASGPGTGGVRAGSCGLEMGAPAAFVHYATDPAELLHRNALRPDTVYMYRPKSAVG
ncbi:MAG: amidohydrolase family protein [Bowdeniella nasicola]|nr:amidohydrolase family protein [Bowdeniella nasicola]